MNSRWPVALGWSSVALFALVNGAAAALAPEGPRPLLLICGLLAVLAAARSARGEQGEMMLALMLSLPAVAMSMAGPPWRLGTLGVLLLLAGELNALGRDVRVSTRHPRVVGDRLIRVAQLGLMALAVSYGAALVALVPALDRTAAVTAAGASLVALSWIVFGGGGSGRRITETGNRRRERDPK